MRLLYKLQEIYRGNINLRLDWLLKRPNALDFSSKYIVGMETNKMEENFKCKKSFFHVFLTWFAILSSSLHHV